MVLSVVGRLQVGFDGSIYQTLFVGPIYPLCWTNCNRFSLGVVQATASVDPVTAKHIHELIGSMAVSEYAT